VGKSGTLELIARELGELLAPLQERLGATGPGIADLFSSIGIRLPDSIAAEAGFVASVTDVVAKATALAPKVVELAAAVDAEDDDGSILAVGAQVIALAGQTIAAVSALESSAQAALAAAPLSAAEKAQLQAVLPQAGTRLVDFLVIEYAEARALPVVQLLTLLGIIERDADAGDPASSMAPPFVRRALRLERLSSFLEDPAQYLADAYGWGQPGFDGRLLFQRIKDLLEAYDYPVLLLQRGAAPPILEAYLAALQADPATTPPSLRAKLRFAATEDFSRAIPIAAPWSLRVGAKARFDAGADARLTLPLDLQVTPPNADATLQVSADLVADDGGRPIVLLGKSGGSRLEARRIAAGAGVTATLNGGVLRAEPVLSASVEGGKLLIDLSEGDGFIQSILSGVKVESDFALSVAWTPSRGVVFVGGAAIELVVPLHLNLGPVEIQTLYFIIEFGTGAPLSLGVAAAIKAQIGPFGMAVEKLGFNVPMKFPADRRGNLGPLDLAFAFRPPTGIGVVIDAGPITGGGFLSIDVPNGRYAGILQLGTPLVSVTAIGLLDTRLPGGASGFSFLILVSVEFPPIQLGFGFTLNAVGGLAGIHRTVATDVLRQGIRAGVLNSVMFPRDPVQNAPQIIANLRSIFPPAQNRFLFGPFLKIGWGTPSLITGSLGVILELPDPVRILILGQLKVVIPVPELPLVSLNLDVLGIIDFGEKLLSIDASLYDSRVTAFNVYGDMALRLSWGSRPVFALSMGGLHPQFRPPPNFPDLRRLTIEIGDGDNPRLTCQSYFAVTSNSVQFGARVEAYASAGRFSIHGWLGFDALVIFVPFSFLVDISAGVELRRGSRVIAGIHLDASLSGPNPWIAKGRACISLFFFDVCVPVRVQVGEEQGQPVPQLNAWDRLREALVAPQSWEATLPPGGRRTIGYAQPTGAPATLIDPAGGLTVHQKVLPLNLQLDKLGEAHIDGASRFDVSHVRVGSAPSPFAAQQDFFASGQYLNLTDAEKLSRESYERMDAGVAIAPDALTLGDAREKELTYEPIIIDAEPGMTRFRDFTIRRLAPVGLRESQMVHAAGRALADLAPATGLERFALPLTEPAAVAVDAESWTVTSTMTLERHAALGTFTSQTAARQALGGWLRTHPGETAAWQVGPSHEVAA
jgi:hypothetical protein